ncbi:MAG: hydrogenase iron-sulfur subunit [Deltaproteobacteria bacterium]|nr:hydrogenase iron-sulfur subunit [Deltaproteobacteria bacterium]
MEGNYYARRKFALLNNHLDYIGIEPERLHFSWISSAEAGKFAEVATEVIENVKKIGPIKKLVKERAEVA